MDDKIKEKKDMLDDVRDNIRSSLFAGNGNLYVELRVVERNILKEIRDLEMKIKNKDNSMSNEKQGKLRL